MHSKEHDLIIQERLRITQEYERRESECKTDLYAPWQPGEMFMLSERKRVAATMLNCVQKFPRSGDKCLEVGYGKMGWLADLISWGVKECDLHGIELDGARASVAKRSLPSAHLEVGDATALPWEDHYFNLAVVSTVMSSIQDQKVRRLVAGEIDRVLSPGGVVVIYDTAVNNPGNKSLYPVSRKEIAGLFSNYLCFYRSVTLAPPISRFFAKYSWTVAEILRCVPVLRTHFLAVLLKK